MNETFDRSRIHQETLFSQTAAFVQDALGRESQKSADIMDRLRFLRVTKAPQMNREYQDYVQKMIVDIQALQSIVESVVLGIKDGFFHQEEFEKTEGCVRTIELMTKVFDETKKTVAEITDQKFFEMLQENLDLVDTSLNLQKEYHADISSTAKASEKTTIFHEIFEESYFTVIQIGFMLRDLQKWFENKPKVAL